MSKKMTKKEVAAAIEGKLSHIFSVTPDTASDSQIYKACALVARDLLLGERAQFSAKAKKDENSKKVYYLCMEFLMGRSLKNALFNLGLTKEFESVLKDYGVKLEEIEEQEPDAGLGNGEGLPPATLTGWQIRALMPWVIPFAMNTVFSAKR